MTVHFIAVSQNAKTGPIPVSIIERASCWPSCALYDNGCYAETGVLALHWGRVSRGVAGGSWTEFCAKIAALPTVCDAMGKPAICRATVRQSTARCCDSSSPPTPASA